jgi:NAD-dependent dihydropyrimidine dehydrogenase PreA subunit/flavodoxin
MTGLYFSGTGNTKHCVEEFVQHFDPKNQTFSIETAGLESLLADETLIVFGYPVYFSNIPKIVRDFIVNNAKLFNHKKVFIIATMGLFSGDGAGCSARLLRKYGAEIIGGLHLKMPDCIGDVSLLKKTPEENKGLIRQSDEKIAAAAKRCKEGYCSKEGLNILYHIAGLFGQRLWFYRETLSYKDKPTIDLQKCKRCGICIQACPMGNLEKKDGDIIHHKRCTMCYRCVNMCPAQALTVIGKRVVEQCLFEKYQ